MAREREVLSVRELGREDLEVLRPARPAPTIQRFRDSHHFVARFLAAGLSVTEVAEKTGYSMNRIMQLKQVPAFQELVSSYREIVNDGYKGVIVDYLTLKMSNRLKAERMLSEKLDKADEEEELLPTRDLISISREQDKNTNIQVNIGDFAEQLDRAKRQSMKVIEQTAQPAATTTKPYPQREPVGQSPRRKYG